MQAKQSVRIYGKYSGRIVDKIVDGSEGPEDTDSAIFEVEVFDPQYIVDYNKEPGLVVDTFYGMDLSTEEI